MSTSTEQALLTRETRKTLLAILTGVGWLSLGFALYQLSLRDWLAQGLGPGYLFFLSSTSGAVFAILFAIAAWHVGKLGQSVWLIGILPLLAFALLPVFSSASARGHVPIGGIVMFSEPFKGCPDITTWKEVEGLVGRFPIGAGKDGDRDRIAGYDYGEATIAITIENMPRHRHGLPIATESKGNPGGFGLQLHGQNRQINLERGEYTKLAGGDGNATEEGPGIPLKLEPPAMAVHFCERIR